MRLGEMLIERRLIEAEDLERALEIQKDRGEKLGKILVDLGFAAMRDILAALSEQLSIELWSPDGPPPATAETGGLTARFLRQSKFIPYPSTNRPSRSPWRTRSILRPGWRCRASPGWK